MKTAAGRLRSKPDLVSRLHEQIRFLERSAAAYDDGIEEEAKRLAVAIRVLLHETTTSRSVLGQLGLLEVVQFLDSALPVDPRNLLPTLGLYGVHFAPGVAEWLPFLGSQPGPRRTLPFADWWTATVTWIPAQELGFTRREYVLGVANTEGGAHVDPMLDPLYAALQHDNALGTLGTSGPGVDRSSRRDPALAGVRQIAWEVVTTLQASPLLRAGGLDFEAPRDDAPRRDP
jgi:hypothetical protein